MSNKPQIKIKGKIQDMNKKQKNVKPKHSNFLLTINTNQQYKDNDEHLQDDIEIFDHSIKTILNNIDQYINLPETDKWDDNTIKDVDVDYVIERGGKKGQLHIHILFKFQHHSRLQLNYDGVVNHGRSADNRQDKVMDIKQLDIHDKRQLNNRHYIF
jgi:hypothetical protein